MRAIKAISILFLLFLITGCTSFFPFEKNELDKIKKHETIIVEYKDGNKLYVNDIERVDAIDSNSIRILKYDYSKNNIDSVGKVYSLKEVKSIKAKRFDYGKTFFTIVLGVPLVLVFTIAILYPDGISVGG